LGSFLPCTESSLELNIDTGYGKIMLLAPNVFAWEPETDRSKITPERLRAHGWPEAAVEMLLRRKALLSGSNNIAEDQKKRAELSHG
jgi:hypothetical protein